jgi:hypothetical protein
MEHEKVFWWRKIKINSDMENIEESWFKSTKNHLRITKLAGNFGWIVAELKTDIEKIIDLQVKESVKCRLEDLKADDKMFDGDNGSTQNLLKYENLFQKLVELKQDVEKILKG